MYHDIDAPADPATLHQALYAGAIVRLRSLDAMAAMVAFARGFIEDFLHPHLPTEIHRHRPQAELAELLAAAQRAFSNHAEAKRRWQEIVVEAGLDPAETARDRLILRFQPPHPPEARREWARSTATVGFHRDSWGTNLYAQVNWWAPVYPITAGRTFAFYPDLFDRPLANSSATFDLAEVIRRQREAPETFGPGESVPRLLEAIDPAEAQPVVIEPGEIIAFSSQHAHAGVENHTDLTRISLDTRTLQITDQQEGRGARNVDGRAKWVAFGMFRRMSDGKQLPEVLGVQGMAAFDALALPRRVALTTEPVNEIAKDGRSGLSLPCGVFAPRANGRKP
jgi:hypothetical protein